MALVRVDPNCAVPVGATAEPLIAGADSSLTVMKVVALRETFPASSAR